MSEISTPKTFESPQASPAALAPAPAPALGAPAPGPASPAVALTDEVTLKMKSDDGRFAITETEALADNCWVDVDVDVNVAFWLNFGN